MPLYEYVCRKCRSHFEVITSLSSTEPVKCKKCGSLDVTKAISAASFRMGRSSSIPSGGLPGCNPSSGFS